MSTRLPANRGKGKALKMTDRSSHTVPSAPRGLLYWSTVKISPSLTNNVHVMAEDLHRSFGKDVLGTGSFTVNDGTPKLAEYASPTDTPVAGTDNALMVRASQVRTVPNPDAIPDPEMPGTGNGSIARFASHSANGEDASSSASISGAITSEPVNARRIAVDAYLISHPTLTYRQAWNAVQALQDAKVARQAAKAARNRRRRSGK